MLSRTLEEYINHTGMVLWLRRDAGVPFKLKKCAFFTNRIDYLDHIIWPGRLEVANQTAVATHELKTPTIDSEPRFFLGLCNMFRKIVPKFARNTSPLSKCLKKILSKDLEPLQNHDLKPSDTLKEKPVLSWLKQNGHYILHTDACDIQVRCVFL